MGSFAFEDFVTFVAQSALSNSETLATTYGIAVAAIQRGIPGDFVECGVFKGAQSAMMALAGMRHDKTRRVHLFDNFTGIPQAGPEDIEFLEAGHPAGLSACSLDECKANMRAWGIPDELLVWHTGMFQETIPFALSRPKSFVQSVNSIAVLRLDGDLYESTKVCIENLYPLVSPGGWIIVDDWDLSGARKAVTEHVKVFGPTYFQKG